MSSIVPVEWIWFNFTIRICMRVCGNVLIPIWKGYNDFNNSDVVSVCCYYFLSASHAGSLWSLYSILLLPLKCPKITICSLTAVCSIGYHPNSIWSFCLCEWVVILQFWIYKFAGLSVFLLMKYTSEENNYQRRKKRLQQ